MKLRHITLCLLAAIVGCGSPATIVANRTAPLPPSPAAHCVSVSELPDQKCTPGAVNTQVVQANIGTTICKSGWTKTIRPPVALTDALKQEQMKEYGFTDSISNHKEDHLIPLEVGGDPGWRKDSYGQWVQTSVKNLWPEPAKSSGQKDQTENKLRKLVCGLKMTLKDAQTRVAQNWKTAVP